MRRLVALATGLLALLVAAPAQADFGLSEMGVSFTDEAGNPEVRAGAHPFAVTTSFKVNTVFDESKGVEVVDGALRNLDIEMPVGLAGNPTAVPRCATLDFLTSDKFGNPACSDSTAVGILTAVVGGGTGIPGEETVSVHNLEPSPGTAAKIGFWVGGVPTTVDLSVNPDYPHNVVASLINASQIVEVLSSEATLWGNPASFAHDKDRGDCAYEVVPAEATCPAGIPVRPFITMPRTCDGPLVTTFSALSWWSGNPVSPGPPTFFEDDVESPGMTGCEELELLPTLDIQPTTKRAASASGLDVRLEMSDPGLDDPDGRANSDLMEAEVALPEGMTVNPSQAEGLATCSEAQLEGETLSSEFGEGCPAASKIGDVEVETPLLEGEILKGSLFVAEPYTNRFGKLLAIYQVIRSQRLGILVKLAGEVEPDPSTGQLITTFGGPGTEPLPQLPFSDFRLHFKGGERSVLITPNRCGAHGIEALFVPWANPEEAYLTTSAFEITSGPNGGPCPAAGSLPFEPGFRAGTVDNTAGQHSAMVMRLTRRDGDQDLTKFSSVLPEGLLPKLVGVAKCPQSAIDAAKGKTGLLERAQPSCPAASQIGTVAAGAGAGSALTYVKGSIYLAGPYKGAPLSAAVITPAVAGPFDVGNVVVQVGLNVDPVTGEGKIDGSASDPIPHILAGIPLRVRDIQVNVDRPSFVLNPTSCREMAVQASIWGGGLNAFSVADDAAVQRSDRFQAANCAALGFKPRLKVNLKGGTKRGRHPALRSVYRPRPGDANLERLVLRLPRSAFLEQAHIRTICTRVQFAANACPPGAIYGQVTATTPLLEEPLTGPAYLRSSNNELPDLVFDLHGLVDVEVSARIDSIKGGIRATFPSVPDAPITKVVVAMRGGKKGLIVNSRNLCAGKSRANARLVSQSGKSRKMRPVVRPRGCPRSGKRR
ncbi:MAG TPA: hypothetical protein VEQ41_02320 [Solirubrobacterales bacterium]|nr:hypothetical protein [Solirubrobacterales bacterium]